MAPPSLAHADRLAGTLIDGAMGAHHRRRLRNLGHAHSYDPPADGRLWAAGDPPPRTGNALDVLIDGAEALPQTAEAIRGARRHVHIAGWSVTPHFAVDRGEPPLPLRELLADVAAHFTARWSEVTGEPVAALPAAPAPAGDVEVQVVRTVPERQYDFVRNGDFRILEAYVRALRSAQRLVYLESQFLWAPELVDILSSKLRDPPSDAFRVVVVLPSRANNGQEDTRGQLAVLADADRDGNRFLAATISALTGRTLDRVYVHAKVGIVDDRWLTIGSANLNAHSMFNDSEMNVVTCDERLARSTRLRLWAEHLDREEADVAGDPAQVVDELWRPIALEQRERTRRGEPRTHRLVELPPASRRLDRLLAPI